MLVEEGGHGRDGLEVLFVAAENDALPGAKVGGIGDVIRDLPVALARTGATVTVVLPSYGFLHQVPDAARIGTVSVRFRQSRQPVEVFDLPGTYGDGTEAVRMRVLHSPDFAPCGERRVYCDDPDDAPFATDASKYALFGAAVLEATLAGHLGGAQLLHLHDWHASFVAILAQQDPAYSTLAQRRRIFSIHNLALQGIRPLDGHPSSLKAWYPWLEHAPETLIDPRWTNCINPMAAGIRLADGVHTVSPTYADEIVQANEPERGFHGGEGLERDLRQTAAQGRLLGILNGIDYPSDEAPSADAPSADVSAIRTSDTASALSEEGTWREWMSAVARALESSISTDAHVRSVDWIAHQRARDWSTRARPAHVLTSVGRLVNQKAAILAVELEDGRSVLEHLLARFVDQIALVFIGTGDAALEQLCTALAGRHPNFLFINRYNASLADTAYAEGDIFLMPSSFEPCGISQLIAMRQGQPCLVHAVGGLVDTVSDNVDGFQFSGDSLPDQGRALLLRLGEVLEQRTADPGAWQTLCNTAASRRFDWDSAAARYRRELYHLNRETS